MLNFGGVSFSTAVVEQNRNNEIELVMSLSYLLRFYMVPQRKKLIAAKKFPEDKTIMNYLSIGTLKGWSWIVIVELIWLAINNSLAIVPFHQSNKVSNIQLDLNCLVSWGPPKTCTTQTFRRELHKIRSHKISCSCKCVSGPKFHVSPPPPKAFTSG